MDDPEVVEAGVSMLRFMQISSLLVVVENVVRPVYKAAINQGFEIHSDIGKSVSV